jgi:hypothetical protein
MSQLYLPTEHTNTDLALASAIAEAIDSNELFVAWTMESGCVAAPEVNARVLCPERPQRGALAEALVEIGAAFKAFFSFFTRGQGQAADTHHAVRASRSELENA